MCGRIESCLLIGVELVCEGCGLSLNRTQKREGGRCLDHYCVQHEADVTNSRMEYKRKFQNLLLSKCVRAARNDETVNKEWKVKTQGILVATCFTAEQKKIFFFVVYNLFTMYLLKFGVQFEGVLRPNAQPPSLITENVGFYVDLTSQYNAVNSNQQTFP